MLKIDRKAKSFTTLDSPKLSEAAITERHDLQEYICNSPDVFFKELGQDLFVIGKEIQPSDDVQDRIDVLALDREGNAVIVELKRGNNKLQMFQAVSYAGMVATWEPSEFLRGLSVEQQDALQESFLEVDVEEINRNQRLILVAEAFDYSVLIGAEWLNEKHKVDIICCRLSLAKDSASGTEYLVCSNIFPAPEIVQQAVRRGIRGPSSSKLKWPDWDSALAAITNQAVASYFKSEVAARGGQDCYLRKRIVPYKIAGKRRWNLSARNQSAYAWQRGRFDGDLAFWRSGVSQPDLVKEVKDGTCLSFSLSTDKDFQFFHEAVSKKLAATNWTETTDEADADSDQ